MKTENSLIKLRALEPEDIDFLSETENNPEFWELSHTKTPFSTYILKKYIKNAHLDIFTTKQLRLVIECKSEKKAVGFIDLFNYDPFHLRAGVGIVITEKERRKKYAENAVALLIDYSFKILKLNQLYCNISEDNHQSIRLFEISGFKISGTKYKWINSESGFKDVLFLQLINE